MDQTFTKDTRFQYRTWMRTWMKILHSQLKRLKIQKVIKGYLTFPTPRVNVTELNCKVVKKVASPSPNLPFQVYPPFLARNFVQPTFGRSYPFPLITGGRGRGFQLWFLMMVIDIFVNYIFHLTAPTIKPLTEVLCVWKKSLLAAT